MNTVGGFPSQVPGGPVLSGPVSVSYADVSYAQEAKLAEDAVAALQRRGGGAYVHLSGTGCVGKGHAADGATAREYLASG